MDIAATLSYCNSSRSGLLVEDAVRFSHDSVAAGMIQELVQSQILGQKARRRITERQFGTAGGNGEVDDDTNRLRKFSAPKEASTKCSNTIEVRQ
jgi:hypothetical protein